MEDKKILYQALHAAKKEFGPLYKNQKGFKSEYENLIQVYDLVEPILDKHGLMLDQDMEERNGVDLLVTRIIHLATMQTKRSEFRMVLGELDPKDSKFQEEGGMQTYHRRYQIKLMLGLCAEKDDNDGYKRTKPAYTAPQSYSQSEPQQQTQTSMVQGDPISSAQLYSLGNLTSAKEGLLQEILETYGVTKLAALSKKQASSAISQLKGG